MPVGRGNVLKTGIVPVIGAKRYGRNPPHPPPLGATWLSANQRLSRH
ncbi:MAG: hypothetical protein MPJ22_00860 [Pirellulales bacterium]|nr:hypothetical protein [Pirellulales bacterium]